MSAVATSPKDIERLEEYTAVFRSASLQQLYKSLIPTEPKGYYLMTGSAHHCDQHIHLLFAKHGYKLMSIRNIQRNQEVVFVRQNRLRTNRYDPVAYTISCKVKNLMDISSLRDNILTKHKLFNQINNVPETFDWKDFAYNGGLWIVKIDRKTSYCGKDNYIVSTQAQWNSVRQVLVGLEQQALNVSGKAKEFAMKGAVVCKYINNPLLHEGKKCHFRPYIMIRSWDKAVITPFIRVYTAKNTYIDGDYANKDIHDSHFASTPSHILVTDTKIAEIVKSACQPLLDLLDVQVFTPYKESKYGYHILAPDILLDADYNAYILEVNTTPGLGDLSKPGIEEFEEIFSTWEFENGILPLLN